MRTADEIITAVNLEIMAEMGLDIAEYTLICDFAIRCINVARKELIDEIANDPNKYIECQDNWRHDVNIIYDAIESLKNKLI
jgi:hypothetical protein